MPGVVDPGNPPRFDEVRNVPHGALQIRTYTSTPLKESRKLYVYTPPQYDTEPGRRFPVLYLRHGSGDNEENWSDTGRAGVILDNLIAQHKAVPMIIVMPNGDTDGSWAGGSSPEGIELLTQELLTDIIPMIDRTYRVARGRENRAITGLSMGGGQAFTMGLKHMDMFAWVGEFSSGLVSDTEFQLEKYLPGFLEHPRRTTETEAAVPELRHEGSAVSGTTGSGGYAEGSTASSTSGSRRPASTNGKCGVTRWPSSRHAFSVDIE